MRKRCKEVDKNMGTIAMEMADLPVQTADLEIAGFKWELRWEKDAKRCVVVASKPNCMDRPWLCYAKYSFEADHQVKSCKKRYTYMSNRSTAFDLPNEGGRRAVSTNLKMNIEVLWAAHESCFPQFDAILSLKYGKESREFLVNRHTLASHSPTYFDNFFFGDWAEQRNKKKLKTSGNNAELEVFDIEERTDINLDAFGTMLDFVHLAASAVAKQDLLDDFGDNELLDMLVLSVKYTLPMLVHCGQQNLIERGHGIMEELVAADAHNLPELKKHCLETIDTIEFGKNLTKNVSLLSKLGKETLNLLDKRIKETAQRYSRKRKMLEKDTDDSDSDACSLFSRYSR